MLTVLSSVFLGAAFSYLSAELSTAFKDRQSSSFLIFFFFKGKDLFMKF